MVVTKARALILDSGLSDKFWVEAVNTVVYLHTRSLSRAVGGVTPFEKLFGEKPQLGHLCRFRCAAYKLIPEAQRKRNFAERAKKCVFLRYVHEMVKIWRLWDPQSKRVIQASDVRFVEAEIIGERRVGNEEELEILKSCIPDNMQLEDDEAVPMDDVVIPTDTSSCIVNVEDQAVIVGGRISPVDPSPLPEGQRKAVTNDERNLRPVNPPALMLCRSGRHGRLAQEHAAMLGSGASDEAESDLLSYWEALGQSHYANWKDAMGAEFSSLIENKTCTYCSTVPVGAHPIGCMWVYLLKTNPDGSRRFKV